MASADEDTFLAGQLLKMQIILIVLLAGCVVFGIVAFIMRQGGGLGPPAAQPIVSYVLLAFAVMELIPLVLIRHAIVHNARGKIVRNEWPPQQDIKGDTAKLLMLYTTRLIVGGAILEGATFGLIIAFLIDATSWTLIAALVFLVLNALQFPTRTRVERWLDEQQELLQQERMAI